ncbi:MAG: hypothetical protein KDA92_19220 [Planctomycetales bacterium]|nr:hypothetical protein [Planctomycetales bacterium]
MVRIGYLVIAILSAATPVSAAVIPLSAQRTVRVAAETIDMTTNTRAQDGDEQSSMDRGAFDSTLSARVNGSGASASQSSSITPQQVTAVGSSGAGAIAFPGDFSSGGHASSRLHYEFSVEVDTPYTIEGAVKGKSGAQFVTSHDTRISLSSADAEEPIFFVTSLILTDADVWEGNDTVNFSHMGMLSPGTYTLDAIADADADLLRFSSGEMQESGSYQFTVSFVPEPTAAVGLLAALPLVVAIYRRSARKPTNVII